MSATATHVENARHAAARLRTLRANGGRTAATGRAIDVHTARWTVALDVLRNTGHRDLVGYLVDESNVATRVAQAHAGQQDRPELVARLAATRRAIRAAVAAANAANPPLDTDAPTREEAATVLGITPADLDPITWHFGGVDGKGMTRLTVGWRARQGAPGPKYTSAVVGGTHVPDRVSAATFIRDCKPWEVIVGSEHGARPGIYLA